VTDPPGLFIYNLIGSVGFSASRNKSCAVRRVDGMSDTLLLASSGGGDVRVQGRLLVRVTVWSRYHNSFLLLPMNQL
jgi:hypothetical protein